jgi:NAD(P)-dependent dehydrogenase (short-subunit alcohol dehydrogenase family)
MDHTNRVAVITGATGGLGRVVARRFGQAGARLALFSSNEDRLSKLAEELALPSESWMTRALNFRHPDSAEAAIRATLDKFGRADMLLHFVGGWTGGKPLVDVEANQMEEMLHQHVWTTFRLIKAFVPHFLANRWGRIVIISSPNAGMPSAKSAPYAAAKAAQEALILALAQEIRGSGVTANVIRVQAIDVKHQRDREPSPTNTAWTSPEEIASNIVYLCSEDAKLVNGARIPLYGGP